MISSESKQPKMPSGRRPPEYLWPFWHQASISWISALQDLNILLEWWTSYDQ
jgi:hypothetical protein